MRHLLKLCLFKVIYSYLAIFRMNIKEEQRICIKVCVKNEISVTKTLEMLSNAFVDNTISQTRVLKWHRRFKAGRNSTEDDARIGRPKTSVSADNVEIIKEMVISNSRITAEELVVEISITHGSCHAILCKHLKMRHVAAKVVPKLLTFERKSIRQSISEDMLSGVNSYDTFLKRIITGDETWVYGYDMETKKQSSQ